MTSTKVKHWIQNKLSGWETRPLIEVCAIFDNLREPLSSEVREKMKGRYPYYWANGIVDFIDRYSIDGDYILIAEDGGNFEQFESRPIAYKISGKAWVNNHAHILKTLPNFSQEFVFRTLEHKNVLNYINGWTRSKLNKSELEGILLDIPLSLIEQGKIAEILSTIDDLISETEKAIQKKKKIKDGLMEKFFSGDININTDSPHEKMKQSEAGMIPETWETEKLSNLSNFIKDWTHWTHADVSNWIPLLSAKDILDGKVRLNDSPRLISESDYNWIHKTYRIEIGDILLTIVWTIGRVALVSNMQKFSLQRSVAIIRLNKLSKLYARYFFESNYFQNLLKLSTNSSAQWWVYLWALWEIFLKYPRAIQEQEKIAEVLSIIDELIDNLKMKHSKLESIKHGLTNELLSGNTSVTSLI